MIHGIFAGLRVLFWAVVLFFLFIYFLALAMVRILKGDSSRQANPVIDESFGKVPWGMLTIFRCFTDGCTAHDGSPLQAHLFHELGAVFLISYMLTVLFVSIGLFNLIMAIFVDNVMESKRLQKQEERGTNRNKVEVELRKVIRQCASRLHAAGMDTAEKSQGPAGLRQERMRQRLNSYEARRITNTLKPSMASSTAIGITKTFRCCLRHRHRDSQDRLFASEVLRDEEINVTREFFQDLIAQPDMMLVLEHLDIDASTHDELFDCLDADMSGSLDCDELVDGLMSLRGPAEKKDSVGALLCARVTQQMLKNLHLEIKDERANLMAEQYALKQQLDAVFRSVNGQGFIPLTWNQNGLAATGAT